MIMPTIPFDDMLKGMADDNPQFASEMLEEALNTILAGDVDDGRVLLRQYVKATIGFQELAKRTGKQDKNLMRSLSASGNPTAANLFEIVQACTKAAGVTVSAHVAPRQHVPA
jgi:DNA-binding phage protein